MNKVIMMGRLTRDPEIRYSQNTDAQGETTAIARYSLAVDRRFKREGEPEADFFNCTAFGKQAEFTEKYLRQGSKILVTGRVQNDNYTNKEGQKVYSVQIMVDEQEFAESKANADSRGSGGGFSPANASGGWRGAQAGSDGFMNIPDGIDEELPFR